MLSGGKKWVYTQNVCYSNLANSQISTYLANTAHKILS